MKAWRKNPSAHPWHNPSGRRPIKKKPPKLSEGWSAEKEKGRKETKIAEKGKKPKWMEVYEVDGQDEEGYFDWRKDCSSRGGASNQKWAVEKKELEESR
jgi:hypothetical protein